MIMKVVALASRVLERWELPLEERAKLLPPGAIDGIDRAAWLLAIHKALQILYPRNPENQLAWLTRRNETFEDWTPIEIMHERGVEGMIEVVHHLESQMEISTRLEVLHNIGAYVLGSKVRAMRWMTSEIIALGCRRPIDVAKNDAGYKECRAVLGAIEHGLVS